MTKPLESRHTRSKIGKILCTLPEGDFTLEIANPVDPVLKTPGARVYNTSYRQIVIRPVEKRKISRKSAA